ncbi:uncharacterized protein LOC104854590 isoform X5 [Fukomys damarensis]|uniref:uncharacterized protein LOC104854590 isoform X5 n=1 Tax=Fukomys damarensis TaxID=885580 RepID=UPI00053FFE35|nr:uncharacterized protein LOC104854590 isoform X5 [Fukomys damarensis]
MVSAFTELTSPQWEQGEERRTLQHGNRNLLSATDCSNLHLPDSRETDQAVYTHWLFLLSRSISTFRAAECTTRVSLSMLEPWESAEHTTTIRLPATFWHDEDYVVIHPWSQGMVQERHNSPSNSP